MDYVIFQDVSGFDWDEGNLWKNWEKHKVHAQEAEQVFFNDPLLLVQDNKHSHREPRFHALGKTDQERLLLVVFTLREHCIRVISARDMHKKERLIYEKAP